MQTLFMLLALLSLAASAQPKVTPTLIDINFDPVTATALRVEIHASADGAQPCIDEFEVYGPGGGANLALAENGATASANGCLPGYAAHRIEHLNDGRYGNAYSWISDETGRGWAQVDLPAPCDVNRVVLSRDRLGQYPDRQVGAYTLRFRDAGGAWYDLARDRLQVVDLNAVPDAPPPATPPAHAHSVDLSPIGGDTLLLDAFLREEYARLVAAGRVDFHPDLSAPRYGMERPGPRHAGDDRLPLPTLPATPVLDGALEGTWTGASRGVARVAHLDAFADGPLVEQAVHAGIHGDHVYFAVEAPRLLSSHVALVSCGDWTGCGAVVYDGSILSFQPFFTEPDTGPAFEGAIGAAGRVFEFRLPRAWFGNLDKTGLRVGLGLGGKYTARFGRPVTFTPKESVVAQAGPWRDGYFPVRVGDEVRQVPSVFGPVGPEAELALEGGATASLHLLHYVPAAACLDQGETLLERLAAKGVDVTAARAELAALRTRLGGEDRQALLEARAWKRSLFLSDPGLAPAERLLFVKRHPFNPSHNYSVILDAPWRPGGGICTVRIPRHDGRLKPEAAEVATLFDAKDGLARTPMADFDGRNVYFASDKNIDVTQGTLSFWLKPLDWSGSEGGFNVFFRTQAGRRNHFMLYKFFHNQRLRMIIGEDTKWMETATLIGHWQPGVWRHLAVTWSPAEQRLFVDGQLAAVQPRRFPLENGAPVEPISVGPGGTWAKGFIGHSLVDEFRIHDRPLSHAEIVSIYRLDADAALLDSDRVTLGRRSPTLDGRIEPFEYAFSGTGFSDLRGLAALRQSHFALSYDKEKLYVAFRDPG